MFHFSKLFLTKSITLLAISGLFKLSFLFPGTSSKSRTTQALLQMAVYIANTFYLTSNSIVPMIQGKDVVDENIRDHNLIIVGEISFTAPYLEKVPLKFGEDHSISIGKILLVCTYTWTG